MQSFIELRKFNAEFELKLLFLPCNIRLLALRNSRKVPVFGWQLSTMAIDDESVEFSPFVCYRQPPQC